MIFYDQFASLVEIFYTYLLSWTRVILIAKLIQKYNSNYTYRKVELKNTILIYPKTVIWKNETKKKYILNNAHEISFNVKGRCMQIANVSFYQFFTTNDIKMTKSGFLIIWLLIFYNKCHEFQNRKV